MLVDLSSQVVADGAGDLPDWIKVAGSRITVSGDPTLDRQTYVAITPGHIQVSTDLRPLVAGLRGRPEVSDEGVSHLLGTGFTPLPTTIYRNIWRAGAGDRLSMDASGDPGSVAASNSYPWMSANSRQDAVPDAARLLELIVGSVDRRVSDSGGVLMMSAGLDSVALAVAIAELGYDIPCVTYRADEGNREHEFAAQFCRKLGLSHQTVEMPRDRHSIRRLLTSFFASSVMPSADHAMIPFVVTLEASGVVKGAVIDGSGNDGYMGYVTSKRRKVKRALRVRGKTMQRIVARSSKVDSRINYLARSRSAAAWPGRNLRHHEISKVYAAAVDPEVRWREEDRRLAGWSDHDRAEANMVRQLEGARTLEKVRLAAAAMGMTPVLPFCDSAIAEYVFHLPEASRYGGGHEKLLLRQILNDRLGYEESGVQSGFFAFDGASFFSRHADFVRDEIRSCTLWRREIGPMVDGWLDAVEQRPFLFHGLLNLFAVSGWHNHSRYLKV